VTLIFVLERRCECSISNGLPVLGETEKMKEITFSRSAANSMTDCVICTGSMTLEEVVDASDKEIDDNLCRRHLQDVYDAL